MDRSPSDLLAVPGWRSCSFPELPGTRISGCARWLSDKHAMVGLTIRYKTDDQLWFTFFHEVAHILLHRDRQSFVVDNAAEDMGDEVVDPDMAKYEEEADRFAADTLIPPAALAEFLRLHGEELTNERHPRLRRSPSGSARASWSAASSTTGSRTLAGQQAEAESGMGLRHRGLTP